MVEDACRRPVTVRAAPTVDEALELKPPVSVLAPVTVAVPPIETLLPIVVAARAPAEGSRASKLANNRETSFSLRCILFNRLIINKLII